MGDETDVVVVGGGLAGLTAATVAARAGARVVLLEARSGLGGRARTQERGGYSINEGPHALYRAGEGIEVLRRLGVEPDGARPPTAGAMGLRAGRLGLLPGDPTSLLRSPLLGGRGKLQLGSLLARVSRLDPGPLAEITVRAWVAGALGDPGARDLLHAVIRLATYVDDPDHLSAGAAVTQVKRALRASVLYLHGGWATLVDGLLAAARHAGVTIRHGVKVTTVRCGSVGTGAVDVEVGTGAGGLRAGAVVLAAGGPGGAASMLGPTVTVAARWAEEARPVHAAVLDVGLRRPWGDAHRFVLGVDRPLYLSVHGDTARLAPEGATLVTAVRYLGTGPSEPGADRRELETMLDGVRPGWRDHAAEVVFRQRLQVAGDLPRAAVGGLTGRPGPEVAGAPGVFVAGDWVGPVGQLADAALASAEVAGRRAADVGRRARAAA